MMDVPKRRERTIVEAVIAVPDGGLMADDFDKSLNIVTDRMRAEGVNLGYGDSYKVRVADNELIFEYIPTAERP
ncbi:hypothetical protein HOT31_gp021 [Microbacterium phage Hendrix]|uniref:Uncharacterized protein n=1 Tax=Microbacterium phage Hendrix TaxID=2182341 RepID=A0A2U8UUE7_9CAUD|nr:hypothetical protein HOT31_gp021 [Microbacterium phage Hendrix]AWN07692.1 hypothetical protein PBI_HENDRIX_21 [Microbacterium phage Hendrix]